VRIRLFIKKILFGINIVFALLLLLSCFVPYIPTDTVPAAAFFSLSIPVLVLGNILFLVFWLFLRKKQLMLSFIVLLIGYFSLTSFFMFHLPDNEPIADGLKIMTYNVRGFYGIRHSNDVQNFDKLKGLITEEDPDIVCFQEFEYKKRDNFEAYPYKYLEYIKNQGRVKLGVYSKYPILDKGLLNFPNTGNDAAFVDVLYKKDTIRIYNLHLESLRVVPNPKVLDSRKLLKCSKSKLKL